MDEEELDAIKAQVNEGFQQMAAEVYYDQLEASMPLYNFLSKLGL